jgi:hypothetical protein
MLIVISDPHLQETDLTQFRQLNIQTILLRGDESSFQSDGLKKYNINNLDVKL